MPEASDRRTLADHFEATKIEVVGPPDHTERRRQRMRSMVFDGRELGDYELEAQGDKEQEKRFQELQGMAFSISTSSKPSPQCCATGRRALGVSGRLKTRGGSSV